ncbi:hypothetical protein [Campylobacter estrildidarum]|uniref:Periplasmic protein n=1 Tax=Campylobacter estrildidarum TaxID=2510189 RepID=A0A4U7BHP8_9BACT|nr:hypothetical protein [Campylobacter estrildidarum]TKX30959.1 hypothetical protein CQA69_04470 [Campylobacter estrildidarum]
MKKLATIFLSLYSLSYANIYEDLSDFAYKKVSDENFKVENAKIVHFFKNNKECLDLLISPKQVQILKSYNSCKNLEKDVDFNNFLNKDFLTLYKNDGKFIQEKILDLKNVMQDIMLYYKLHYAFSKDIKDMSKNKNLNVLNSIDTKEGGTLLYRINNQTCVGIELKKHNSKMAMKIYGIENLDKKCKLFIESPDFKNISYTTKDFNWYYLE